MPHINVFSVTWRNVFPGKNVNSLWFSSSVYLFINFIIIFVYEIYFRCAQFSFFNVQIMFVSSCSQISDMHRIFVWNFHCAVHQVCGFVLGHQVNHGEAPQWCWTQPTGFVSSHMDAQLHRVIHCLGSSRWNTRNYLNDIPFLRSCNTECSVLT